MSGKVSEVMRAQSRRSNWTPRGGLCPICGRSFQNSPDCTHSEAQARDRLDEDVIRAIVRSELARARNQ